MSHWVMVVCNIRKLSLVGLIGIVHACMATYCLRADIYEPKGWLWVDSTLWLVFESPVWSSLLPLWAWDQDQDWSKYIVIKLKLRLDHERLVVISLAMVLWPVWTSLLKLWPVLTSLGLFNILINCIWLSRWASPSHVSSEGEGMVGERWW